MTLLTRIARRAVRVPALMRRARFTASTIAGAAGAAGVMAGVLGVPSLAFAYDYGAQSVPVMNREASVTVSSLDNGSSAATLSSDVTNANGNGNGNGNAYASGRPTVLANANGNAYGSNTAYANNYDAVQGAANPDGTQDLNVLQNAAQAYLLQQTDGLPGRVVIALTPTTAHGLAACQALEPFLPPGVRLWGRAMVGVRCNGERPWTIYLQARIGVIGDYYVAARTLNAGDSITMQDLSVQHGDLTALPGAIITNPSQVVGSVAMNRVSAGMPLRSDLIRAALAVRYGQQVKVIASGAGFSVQSEGSALANAAPGQAVRIRTGSGVIISGIAQADSSVNVPL